MICDYTKHWVDLDRSVGCALAHAVAKTASCKVMAHRGNSRTAPENTIASVIESLELDVDVCEFDVRCTKDGYVVLMHDETIDRTTNGTGRISDTTLPEAKLLDTGSWKSDKYIGQTVPALDEVLAVISDVGKEALIEIKDDSAAASVAQLIEKYSMTHSAVALTSSPQVHHQIKAINKNIRRALLCTEFPANVNSTAAKIKWLIEMATELDVEIVDLDYRFVCPELIGRLHAIGKKAWVWTVNSPVIMKCLIDWGIDGITSDTPAVLKKVAGSGEVTFPEVKSKISAE